MRHKGRTWSRSHSWSILSSDTVTRRTLSTDISLYQLSVTSLYSLPVNPTATHPCINYAKPKHTATTIHREIPVSTMCQPNTLQDARYPLQHARYPLTDACVTHILPPPATLNPRPSTLNCERTAIDVLFSDTSLRGSRLSQHVTSQDSHNTSRHNTSHTRQSQHVTHNTRQSQHVTHNTFLCAYIYTNKDALVFIYTSLNTSCERDVCALTYTHPDWHV